MSFRRGDLPAPDYLRARLYLDLCGRYLMRRALGNPFRNFARRASGRSVNIPEASRQVGRWCIAAIVNAESPVLPTRMRIDRRAILTGFGVKSASKLTTTYSVLPYRLRCGAKWNAVRGIDWQDSPTTARSDPKSSILVQLSMLLAGRLKFGLLIARDGKKDRPLGRSTGCL